MENVLRTVVRHLVMLDLRGVLLATLVACGGGGTQDDDVDADVDADASTSGVPTAQCETYLVVAPQSYAAQLQLYGESSECWATSQQSANCNTACVAAFEDISSMCTCTGTTCVPSTPQAECVDSHEPNNTAQQASPASANITGAICPANDVDFYTVTVAGGGSLGAIVTFAGSVAPQLALLNAGGNSIANDTQSGQTVDANAPGVPPGTYFIRVAGSAKIDYQLVIAN